MESLGEKNPDKVVEKKHFVLFRNQWEIKLKIKN